MYLLCNKHAALTKVSWMKKKLLQNSKKRSQKRAVINLIFIALVKNKEHMSYHWAHYTHKSHIQAQTQKWQIISPQMNACTLPADKEFLFRFCRGFLIFKANYLTYFTITIYFKWLHKYIQYSFICRTVCFCKLLLLHSGLIYRHRKTAKTDFVPFCWFQLLCFNWSIHKQKQIM